jgi:hypothetical protein
MKLPECSVSAVIPTRGALDSRILDSLHACPEIDDIHLMVGNAVFNRYVGAAAAWHDIIYTQDDDVISVPRDLIDRYRPGVIVHAMTPDHARHYQGRVTLVGFGAIFDRQLIGVLNGWEKDALLLRECDRVFTALNQCLSIFPDITILPCASDTERLWRDTEHVRYRRAIEQRIMDKTGVVA